MKFVPNLTSTRRGGVNRAVPALLLVLIGAMVLGGDAHAEGQTQARGQAQAGSAPRPPTAKDIVLASLAPAEPSEAGAVPSRATELRTIQSDGLVVSILTPGPWGTLTPRSAAVAFKTGERFRVKVLSPRDGEVAFYNTNAAGKTSATPILLMPARKGMELVTEEFQLTGTKGEDQLHIVLVPLALSVQADAAAPLSVPVATASAGAPGASAQSSDAVSSAGQKESRMGRVYAWLQASLGSALKSKATPSTLESTGAGTYAAGAPGGGVAVTVRIKHD